jgi:hypothetical protein
MRPELDRPPEGLGVAGGVGLAPATGWCSEPSMWFPPATTGWPSHRIGVWTAEFWGWYMAGAGAGRPGLPAHGPVTETASARSADRTQV